MGGNSNEEEEKMDKELEKAARKGDVTWLEKAVEESKRSGNFQRFLRVTSSGYEGNILHLAIRNHKNEWVEKAMKLLPEDVIEKLFCQGDKYGDTPLREALNNENIDIIERIVKKDLVGRGVFARLLCLPGRRGNTVLHIAAKRGMTEVLKLLCEGAAQDKLELMLSLKNAEGNTPLHLAAYRDHDEVVKYLVGKHQGLAYILNNAGDSMLHLAANKGNISIFKAIHEIDKDGKIMAWNIKNAEGNTPLHCAAIGGYYEIVKLLVEKHEGLPYILNNAGDSMLHLAWKNAEGNTPLHCAAVGGYYEIVKFLVDKQSDLARDKNNFGETSLYVACSHQKFEVALYIASKLPDLAGDMTSRKDTGNTQLHLAALYGNVDAANVFLCQNSGLSRVTNNSKNTPLHVALIHGHVNVAQELIKHDPDVVGHINDRLETPLHLAIKHDKDAIIDDKAMQGEEIPTILKLLVDKASDIVVADKKCVACWVDVEGLTPLHRAAFLCSTFNVRVVKSLIERCPECASVLDCSGNTILHLLIDTIASYEQGLDLLQIPQIDGAMRITKNKQGKTPLDLAWKFNIKMVRALVDSYSQQQLSGEDISPSSFTQQKFEIEMLEKQKMTMEGYGVINRVIAIRERIVKYGMNFILSLDSKGSNVLHKLLNINNAIKIKIKADDYLVLVQHILERNPMLVSQMDFNDDTPIHILVRNNHSIQIGEENDLQDLRGTTILNDLLTLCCKYYYKAKASAKGTPYEPFPPWLERNVAGNTPLHEALIANNDIELLKSLLKLDINVVAKITNKSERMPIHLLAERSSKASMELNKEDINDLINANKDGIEKRDLDGLCPLQRAIKVGNISVIRPLYDAFPEALQIPVSKAESEMLWHVFINHSVKFTLMLVNQNDDIEDFKELIGRQNSDGKTAMHLALERKKLEHAKIFLKYIVDSTSQLTIKDNLGKTPLQLAIVHGQFEFAISLLDFAKERGEMYELLKLQDNEGKTSLHMAINNQEINFATQLFDLAKKEQRGVDLLKLKDKEGKTPFHLVIDGRHFDLLNLFLKLITQDLKTMKDCLSIEDNYGKTAEGLLRSLTDIPEQIQTSFKDQPRIWIGIRSVWDVPTESIPSYVDAIGVIAALVMTVTFTAAFTVPGGYESGDGNPPSKGTPLFLKRAMFQIFMFFDILSMCLSTLVLFCLLWIVGLVNSNNDKNKAVVLMDFSLALLLISLDTTLITFMAGLFATTFPGQKWIAIFSLVICCITSLVVLIGKKIAMNCMVPLAKCVFISLQLFQTMVIDYCVHHFKSSLQHLKLVGVIRQICICGWLKSSMVKKQSEHSTENQQLQV